MKRNVDSILVASYLVLCVLMGGSAQSVWGNLCLQVLGLTLIGFAALARSAGTACPRLLGVVLIAGLAVVLLQLIPLPPQVWTTLPARSTLAGGFHELGIAPPWLPISETPTMSVITLFAAIPPIAVFLAACKLRPDPRWIALVVLLSAVISICWGALQVAGGADSWARLYPISSPGAVGFFANQNHMATLILVAIPPAVLLLGGSQSNPRAAAGRYATRAVLLGLLIFGLILNASFAGYALALPVLLASLAATRLRGGWRRLTVVMAALATLAAITFVATKPIADGKFESSASTSVSTRTQVWATTSEGISKNFPLGTGLGSFEQVYRQFEDPGKVTYEYVNHAHNDYLEVVLELGAPGLVLLLVFLGWWILRTAAIWSSPADSAFARGATIMSGAILAHSAVDFPLRTAAISAIFAVSIAMMASERNGASRVRKGEYRATRHVTLG